MGRVEVSRVINASLEATFEMIANGDNAPKWHHSVVSARHLTPPPIRVGSQLHVQARVGKRPFEWTQQVSSWDPPRSFRDVLVPGAGPFSRFQDWGTFSQEGERTRVTFGVDYTLRWGPLGALIDRLMVLPRLRKKMGGSLEKASRLLEGKTH